MMTPSPGTLAQVACLMEATARKPGNVHRYHDFEDATYLDFALSAQAIGPAMDQAPSIGVGRSVLMAVRATRAVVSTNTNLGMILLLAPMCAADREGWPDSIDGVLKGLTVDDAVHVYQAIRLANPGGLGSARDQDVSDEPTVTLLEAMRLAAGRDLVARQYATGYEDVFGVALPALREGIDGGLALEHAIIRAHVSLLSRRHDTLIARKLGVGVAEEASRIATDALISENYEPLDRYLRADGHARNPGATADLMASALFAAMVEGTIGLPRPSGPKGWSGAS